MDNQAVGPSAHEERSYTPALPPLQEKCFLLTTQDGAQEQQGSSAELAAAVASISDAAAVPADLLQNLGRGSVLLTFEQLANDIETQEEEVVTSFSETLML